MIPAISSAVLEGVEKITDSFRGRPNVEGIQKALTYSIQILEVAAFDVQSKRQLSFATDNALDQIGALVGESRYGRVDDEYREAIRIRIRINRSAGRTLDQVELSELIAGVNSSYLEGDKASYKIRSYNLAGARAVLRTLRDIRPAGVLGVLETSEWVDTNDNMFGSSYDAAAGARGFSSVSDGSVGGVLVSAQVIK